MRFLACGSAPPDRDLISPSIVMTLVLCSLRHSALSACDAGRRRHSDLAAKGSIRIASPCCGGTRSGARGSAAFPGFSIHPSSADRLPNSLSVSGGGAGGLGSCRARWSGALLRSASPEELALPVRSGHLSQAPLGFFAILLRLTSARAACWAKGRLIPMRPT